MGDIKVVDKFDLFSSHLHVLNKVAMRALTFFFFFLTFESIWATKICM